MEAECSSIKNMHSVFWVLFQPWVVKINRVSLSQARHSLSILCSKQKKTRVIWILLDYIGWTNPFVFWHSPPKLSDVAVEVVVILHLRTVPEFLADTRPLSGHEHGVGRLASFRRSTFLGWTSSVFADLTRARGALDGLAATDSLEPKLIKIRVITSKTRFSKLPAAPKWSRAWST